MLCNVIKLPLSMFTAGCNEILKQIFLLTLLLLLNITLLPSSDSDVHSSRSVFIQTWWMPFAVSHSCHKIRGIELQLPVLNPQGYFSGFVSEVWQVHLPCCISGGIWRVRKCVTNETQQHRTPHRWHNFSGIRCVSATVNHKKVSALSRAEQSSCVACHGLVVAGQSVPAVAERYCYVSHIPTAFSRQL